MSYQIGKHFFKSTPSQPLCIALLARHHISNGGVAARCDGDGTCAAQLSRLKNGRSTLWFAWCAFAQRALHRKAALRAVLATRTHTALAETVCYAKLYRPERMTKFGTDNMTAWPAYTTCHQRRSFYSDKCSTICHVFAAMKLSRKMRAQKSLVAAVFNVFYFLFNFFFWGGVDSG